MVSTNTHDPRSTASDPHLMDSSSVYSSDGGNPFAGPCVSSIYQVPIRQHIPVVLNLQVLNQVV